MPAKGLKRLLLNSLLLPGLPNLLRYVQQDCATVFMLHRFEDPDRGINGYSPSHVRNVLTYLVRNGYELISLTELFERLQEPGPNLGGAVAFTIDDGYVEHATVAAPIFSEFSCPVTTFVTTGFLDGQVWFWWDQIEHLFRSTVRPSVQMTFGGLELEYSLQSTELRQHAQADFTLRCKRVPEEVKLAGIAELAKELDVELPTSPPACYAPMSWDQLRACERIGMTFGPHTVTHPILSRISEHAAEQEIADSWARLQREALNPVPLFCYPNGEWADFTARNIDALHRLGFLGAVVAEPGYANASHFRLGEQNAFKVPRFALPEDLRHLVQYVSGVERLKRRLRLRE